MSMIEPINLKVYERIAFWVSGVTVGLFYFLSMASTVMLGRSGLWVASAVEGALFQPGGVPLWIGINGVLSWLLGLFSSSAVQNRAWGMNFFSVLCCAFAVGLLARFFVRVLGICGATLLSKEQGRNGLRWAITLSAIGCAVSFGVTPAVVRHAIVAGPSSLGICLFVVSLWLGIHLFLRPTRRLWILFGAVLGFASVHSSLVYWGLIPFGIVLLLRHRALFLTLCAMGIPILLTWHLLLIGELPSSYVANVLHVEEVVLRPEARSLAEGVPLTFVHWAYYVAIGGLLLLGLGSLVIWPRLGGCLRVMHRLTRHWWLGIAVCGCLIVVALLSATMGLVYVLPEGFSGEIFGFWHVWFLHVLGLGAVGWICANFHRSRRYALGVVFVQLVLLVMMQKGILVGRCHAGVWWFWWPLVWGALLIYMGRQWLVLGKLASKVLGAFLLAYGIQYFVPQAQEALSVTSASYAFSFWQLVTYCCDQYPLVLTLAGFLGATGTCVIARQLQLRRLWLLGALTNALGVACLLGAVVALPEEMAPHFMEALQAEGVYLVLLLTVSMGLGIYFLWGIIAVKCSGPSRSWGMMGLFALLIVGPLLHFARLGEGALQGIQSKDVGWLVGHTLLNGARGAERCLHADEEPLPDPFWPPPMPKDAIVLSDTVTGASLPLYMAQTVGLRKDVHVVLLSTLTQLSVIERMRQFYGEHFWLPTRADLAEVHHRVTIDQGDIKGSLAQQMTRYLVETVAIRNEHRPLYLEHISGREELDRLLVPAGIMLKVAREQPSQLQALGIRDNDFWDWLTRLARGRFGGAREIASLRYFAEARCAIAQVFQQQGFSAYAYRAFMDAMVLYPVYTSMSYAREFMTVMALSRGPTGSPLAYENALRVCRMALEREPKNRAILTTIAAIEKQKSALECCKSLQVALDSGTISPNQRCQYIEACIVLQAPLVAQEVARPLGEMQLSQAQRLLAIRACVKANASETLFTLVQHLPQEQYSVLEREELLAAAAIAVLYHHRPLASGLLNEAQQREPLSPAVALAMAYYYDTFGDIKLAYEHLMRARALQATGSSHEVKLDAERCRQIEERFLRQEEKGTRP